jgi:predicted enzyme related to lactoylglutathione lyase
MANPFVHVELNTGDVGKAKAFYGMLFGWTLEEIPMGPGATYTMIRPGEGTGGGIQKNTLPKAQPAWLAYVRVDDVKAATAKARMLGARIVQDVTDVPGMGAFSVIVDPTGASLGLWEPHRP